MVRVLAFLVAVAAGGVPQGASLVLDPSHDRIVRRASIPSDERTHGEVRIVRRGDATVVQTLLFTNALRRGIQQMKKKELYHWPAGREGRDDSQAFLAELDRAADAVSRDALPRGSDPRRKLLIEIALSEGSARFALYAPELRRMDGELALSTARLLAAKEVSRAYADRAQRLMVATAFHLPEAEAEAALRAAGR
jgi:hypothetical protein